MTLDTQEKKTSLNKTLLWPMFAIIVLLIVVGIQPYQKIQQAKVYYERGMELMENEKFEDARKEFSEAIRIKPDYAEAYYQRGLAYLGSFENAPALEDFERAIELKPKLLKIPNNEYAELNYIYYMRTTFFQDKDYEGGLVYLNRVIQLNPEYERFYIIRGDSYFELGLYEEAIDDFSIGLERNTEELSDYLTYYVYIRRAESYYHLDDNESALNDLDHLIQLGFGSYDVYMLKGYIFGRSGDYQEALLNFNRAIEIVDDRASAYLIRAKTHQALGDNENAEADLLQASSLCEQETLCSDIEQMLEEISEN